jgi:hypothetical protein
LEFEGWAVESIEISLWAIHCKSQVRKMRFDVGNRQQATVTSALEQGQDNPM